MLCFRFQTLFKTTSFHWTFRYGVPAPLCSDKSDIEFTGAYGDKRTLWSDDASDTLGTSLSKTVLNDTIRGGPDHSFTTFLIVCLCLLQMHTWFDWQVIIELVALSFLFRRCIPDSSVQASDQCVHLKQLALTTILLRLVAMA